MNNLLSLDQSSRTTGYAIFKEGKLFHHGKFTLEEDDVGKRLVQFREEVIKLINDYNITEVAFEEIQLQNNVVNNVQTFKILSEIYGVLQELVQELKLPYTIVSSNTWKSTMKIPKTKREEEKRRAQALVQTLFSIKATQDEADAICLGAHMVITKKNSWD